MDPSSRGDQPSAPPLDRVGSYSQTYRTYLGLPPETPEPPGQGSEDEPQDEPQDGAAAAAERRQREAAVAEDVEEEQRPDTSCDEAIAKAIAEAAAPPPAPPEDTSLDAALALQLHEDEVDRLCGRQPLGEVPVSLAAELDRLISSQLSGSRLCRLVPRLNPAHFLCGYGGPSMASGPGRSTYSRDRERLMHRLAFYGLAEKEVPGDGNCQFSALSDQLFRTPAHHAQVRARVVARLRARPERYAPYVVGGDYGDYVARMARLGTWGDHVTLQAAADAWGIRIFVVTSFLENCVISIEPEAEDPAFAHRALHLSFWAEVHYGSIYPASDPPKLLGSRRLSEAVRGAASWIRH